MIKGKYQEGQLLINDAIEVWTRAGLPFHEALPLMLFRIYSFEYGLKLIEDRLAAKRKGLKS